MARVPWRDALDGKYRLMKATMSPVALTSFKSYFMGSPTLAAVTKDARHLEQGAERLAESMQKIVHEHITKAEPFYLTNDIFNELDRQSPKTPARKHGLLVTDPPVPFGTIWLPTTYVVGRSTEYPEGVDYIRALVWYMTDTVQSTVNEEFNGKAWPQKRSVIGPSLDGRLTVEKKGLALNIILYLDLDKYKKYHPRTTPKRVVPGTLVPYITSVRFEGETLQDVTQNAVDNYDNEFDRMLHVWAHLILETFFLLLQRKKLYWGGARLDRDATRQAERDNLKPIVQVVTWRKAEYKYLPGHIVQPVDWAVRWSVKEHVRRYKSGKVVVIKSYVKGPDDKPFKRPNEILNVVKR